jgi:hypothetical protein
MDPSLHVPLFARTALSLIWSALAASVCAQSIPDAPVAQQQRPILIAEFKHTLAPPTYPEYLYRFPAINDSTLSSASDIEKKRVVADDPRALVRPAIELPPDTRFKWRVSTRQSLLYTGIMHTFNLATQPGTRDTMTGPWLTDYLNSVSELRGWSDGDRFMAPYVGHTLEGSIFGYIERQNDPKYSRVQWGDGREYFISILRSMAYSAVWHTQWKIGPASEASIGNVMLHASPGFITLANTPTFGTVEIIAEDAADRYLIMGLENRTANRVILVLARSFLNPGRTFANLMAFRLPWDRVTRIGVMRDNFKLRKALLADYKTTGERPFEYVRPPTAKPESLPAEAPIELEAFPVFESMLGGAPGACIGGGGSGAARVNSQLQIITEVSGCLIMNMPASEQSGDSLFYGGGMRWTPRAAQHFSPFLQAMFGGKKVTHEVDDAALHKTLLAEWDDGKGPLKHYPKRSDWSVEDSRNGPAVAFGGGFDIAMSSPLALRLLNIEYTHAWIGDPGQIIHPQNTLRITTGAVLRIGNW